jgi:ATP-dependent RNA helicase RhlE
MRSRFGNNRRAAPVNTIHESKFIKKAVETVEADTFVATMKFSELPIHETIKSNIVKRGYTSPTPIQEGAIAHIMAGKDVIGIANTGTGKTAAFLLPLIQKVLTDRSQRVVIIVPTRELGQQIREELRSFTQGLPVYSAICIGGASMGQQIFDLRRNPQFVIATPGRLKDLIERRVVRMDSYQTIVLDEVDRMVDMGFIHDIRFLISLLPSQRQSLFFSATISPQINTIIKSFLKNPITVSVRTRDTADNVNQDVVRVQVGENKLDILEKLLKNEGFKKVIIFGRTKHGVERLSKTLYQKGFNVAAIHGDKTQSKRQQAIRLFKDEHVSILIATDVAARGIDVPNVTHVINYDQPATYEDYVHRIGRTGRANQKGQALTFV